MQVEGNSHASSPIGETGLAEEVGKAKKTKNKEIVSTTFGRYVDIISVIADPLHVLFR